MTAETRSDRIFKAEIQVGHRWAEHVADRMRSYGIDVEVPPLRIRPERRDWAAYSDAGDLFVNCPEGQRIVEVKSRRLDFGWDVPSYPYPTVFVDKCGMWDRKQHTPVAVVLVSQLTSACLVISVRRTRDLWVPVRSWDRPKQEWAWRYELGREHLVEFSELCAWLWACGG